MIAKFDAVTVDLQIQGVDAALAAGDSVRETDAEVTWWTLTLWGGLEVELPATLASATAIEVASEAEELAGREPLFTIRAGRKEQ